MSLSPLGMRGSSGPEAVELAAACGLVLDYWQTKDLYDALAEQPDGLWAASEVDLIASRQNGKNGELEAAELFVCVVLGLSLIHTAHLFPTARESYYRLMTLIEANPDVKNTLLYNVASPASGYEMRFRSGGRARFIARSRTSGRGLTGDMLVFDEFQDLDDDAQGALLPTISARPNAQSWYLGSAPGLGSTVAHRIRARGRSRNQGRIAYKEYSAEPDANLDDRVAWAQANPAYPYRISEQTIQSERDVMSDEMFARERLSISPDPLEAGGPFGPAWGDVQDPEAVAKAEVFAIDVNPDRSMTAIVAVGHGPVVSVVDYRPGTSWVLERAKYLKAEYRKSFAIDKTGPAGSFIEEFRRNRIRIVELDATNMCRAAESFYDAVTQRSIVVRANDDLDRAVSGAARLPVGDAWKWGRKSSLCDISLLVASSEALWAFEQRSRAKLVSMADLICSKCGGIKADCECED